MSAMPDVLELTPELTEITTGLRFPEGPIAMPDGSIVLVEMFGPRLTRVAPDGTKSTIGEIEGGPNGAAVGPDGAIYLCNNGGCFAAAEFGGMMFPGAFVPEQYRGGRIQRVDPHDGTVTDLYTECDGRPLRAPNDLVMDGHGGFYFTDHGIREERTSDLLPGGMAWFIGAGGPMGQMHVQRAVQHKYAQFVVERMAVFRGLGARAQASGRRPLRSLLRRDP